MKRPHGKPPSQRRHSEPGDVLIVPQDAYAGKPKPDLASSVRFEDLSHYQDEIAGALRKGLEAGMADPIVLVVHRVSRYAREHEVGSDTPLSFRAIDKGDAVRQGLIDPKEEVPDLPSYIMVLAAGESIEVNMGADLTEAGLRTAWRFSATFREWTTHKDPGFAATLRRQVPIVR